MKFGSSHFSALFEISERPKKYTFYYKEKNIAKNQRYDDPLICEHKIMPFHWPLRKEYLNGYIEHYSVASV